jgi:hypothetical protein
MQSSWQSIKKLHFFIVPYKNFILILFFSKERHYEKVGEDYEQVHESYRNYHPAFTEGW